MSATRSCRHGHRTTESARTQPGRRGAWAVGAWAVGVVLALTACSVLGDDEGSGTAEATIEAPTLSVTVPAERRTPFCAAMIDLADQLATDPPADTTAAIVAIYESIVDDVPPEIRDDFLTVLARLQAGETTAPATIAAPPTSAVPPTSDPTATTSLSADEGYDPDDDPALRLNAYVQFACRDTQNNPGPPATPPAQATTEP